MARNEKNTKVVQFLQNTSITFIKMNINDANVIGIAIDDTYGIINTNRNINCNSSMEDIVREYGTNYYKRTWKDFMGSGSGYTITYIDKKNKYKLEITVSQTNIKEDIQIINFSKY